MVVIIQKPPSFHPAILEGLESSQYIADTVRDD